MSALVDNMTEFQQRACAVGLTKMLKAKHFSICNLDALRHSGLGFVVVGHNV